MNPQLMDLGEKIHNALKELYRNGDGKYTVNLAGACAVGSFLFMQEAKRRFNLDLQFKATSGHAWTEFENEVYDITATQFSRSEKVFNIHRDNFDQVKDDDFCVWYYRQTKNLSLKKINETWPDYQRPDNYRLVWLFDTKPIITYSKSKSK